MRTHTARQEKAQQTFDALRDLWTHPNEITLWGQNSIVGTTELTKEGRTALVAALKSAGIHVLDQADLICGPNGRVRSR